LRAARPWQIIQVMSRGDYVDLPEANLSGGAETIAWQMLMRRLTWYSSQSTTTRTGYLAARIAESGLAAAVTVAGALALPSWVPAALGAGILLIESVQQLLQLHNSYISYRLVAEALRNEAWLFATASGDYAAAEGRGQRLAERVRAISLQENATWASAMRQAAVSRPATPGSG
jgi:hypothetical protein